MQEGDYDFIDFVTQNKKKQVFLGRGFCMDCDPIVKISCDGKEVYNDTIYWNNNRPPDVTIAEMKSLFADDHDKDFDDVLSNGELAALKADSHFFTDANKYKYCSLEKVECIGSRSSISISVQDDFRFSDLKVRMLNLDVDEEGSITNLIWKETGLGDQVLGIEYDFHFYEFEGGEDEGIGQEIIWFENITETWSPALELSGRIMELGGECSF